MRADIFAGVVFPDYELTDHTGKHRKLSELQGPDPMILAPGHRCGSGQVCEPQQGSAFEKLSSLSSNVSSGIQLVTWLHSS
jgi:peroxiredoxin